MQSIIEHAEKQTELCDNEHNEYSADIPDCLKKRVNIRKISGAKYARETTSPKTERYESAEKQRTGTTKLQSVVKLSLQAVDIKVKESPDEQKARHRETRSGHWSPVY